MRRFLTAAQSEEKEKKRLADTRKYQRAYYAKNRGKISVMMRDRKVAKGKPIRAIKPSILFI